MHFTCELKLSACLAFFVGEMVEIPTPAQLQRKNMWSMWFSSNIWLLYFIKCLWGYLTEMLQVVVQSQLYEADVIKENKRKSFVGVVGCYI